MSAKRVAAMRPFYIIATATIATVLGVYGCRMMLGASSADNRSPEELAHAALAEGTAAEKQQAAVRLASAKTDADFFTEAAAKALAKADRSVVRSGIARTETHEVDIQGEMCWIEVTRSPIVNDEGDTTGLLWSARNITEFKRMEDAVRKQAKKNRPPF